VQQRPLLGACSSLRMPLLPDVLCWEVFPLKISGSTAGGWPASLFARRDVSDVSCTLYVAANEIVVNINTAFVAAALPTSSGPRSEAFELNHCVHCGVAGGLVLQELEAAEQQDCQVRWIHTAATRAARQRRQHANHIRAEPQREEPRRTTPCTVTTRLVLPAASNMSVRVAE
jgi:hypothetical protein